jgi:hypothetical protein
MQQDTALQQWEASLSIRAAFDQFDFIDKPLNHAVAPRVATSIDDSICIVGQSFHKVDEFRNVRSPYSTTVALLT